MLRIILLCVAFVMLSACGKNQDLNKIVTNQDGSCWMDPKYGATNCDVSYLRKLNLEGMISFREFHQDGTFSMRMVFPDALRVTMNYLPSIEMNEKLERTNFDGKWQVQNDKLVLEYGHQPGCKQVHSPVEKPTSTEIKYRISLEGNCPEAVTMAIAALASEPPSQMVKLPKGTATAAASISEKRAESAIQDPCQRASYCYGQSVYLMSAFKNKGDAEGIEIFKRLSDKFEAFSFACVKDNKIAFESMERITNAGTQDANRMARDSNDANKDDLGKSVEVCAKFGESLK